MQAGLMLPVFAHLFLTKPKRKQCIIESSIAIVMICIAIWFHSDVIAAIFLCLLLVYDVKKSYFLYVMFLLILLSTYTLPYHMFLWIIVVMSLMIQDYVMQHTNEREAQEYQNKVYARQVAEVEHMYTTMRGWRHDYHNHLQNLKAKLRLHEFEASIAYLDELEQELQEIKQLVESGNQNMDAILNAKLSLAVHRNIDLHVKASVPPHLNINDTDMCALLGNLVDNALEACEKCEGKPFLRLYIGQYKGQLYISCTNATSELIRKLDHEYITHKRGNHGHGLKRMNLIVEKYDGMINRKNEPGVFSTEILLPL